jgi:cell division septum initiation protein DivIVA
MESLVEENARLRREVAELRSTVERLERRVQELLDALQEAQRAARRQAAPFSRQQPKVHPAKPGRKAGTRYGCHSRRPVPPVIDQTLEAELPDRCPHCSGELEQTHIDQQYQTEIPQRPRSSGSSSVFMSAGASVADSDSKGVIRAKVQMRWAAPLRNWDRAPSRWPRN